MVHDWFIRHVGSRRLTYGKTLGAQVRVERVGLDLEEPLAGEAVRLVQTTWRCYRCFVAWK